MKIIALPKSKAKEFTCDIPWACISIGCEPGDWPKINKVQQIDILQIAFDDIDIPEMTSNYIIFDGTHARKIWEFVDKIWDKVELIMVHCLAGQSRSPAVAAAISKMKLGDDMEFFKNYTHNMLVYRKMVETYEFHTKL